MSFSQTARNVYSQPEPITRTARSLEYELLARTTQRLSATWASRKQDYTAFINALADNGRVWSTFAADVATVTNGLPPPLRAQLFYLYEFTTLHSRAVLENDASVGVLIDINTAVMRGLRGGAE